MNDPFLGSIIMFGGNFAPSGWALCNGQLMSISQNTALFSILGTTFGGDGVQTFALPDLRGRAPIHMGQGPGLTPYTEGQLGGSESVTLLSSQMPIHNHLVACTGAAPSRGGTNPSGQLPAIITVSPTTTLVDIYATTAATGNMSPQMIATAGGSQPFPVVQPYLCVNFIIALTGIFPSRN